MAIFTTKKFLTLASYCLFTLSVTAAEMRYQLMLAGGGLEICSSMQQQYCNEDARFTDDAKTSVAYLLSQSNINKFESSDIFKSLPESSRKLLSNAMRAAFVEQPHQQLSYGGLKLVFSVDEETETVFRELDDTVHAVILDFFEFVETDSRNLRKREVANLPNSKNQNSVAIYKKFFQQAQIRTLDDQKPRIAVITAGYRDPFERADFYTTIFEFLGADVVWLPLTKSYREARELQEQGYAACQRLKQIRANNLNFKRDEIYPSLTNKVAQFCRNPKLMLNEISNLQGIYFVGEDALALLTTLKTSTGGDTEELELIKLRMDSGKLIVGGSGSGSLIHSGGAFNNRPIPMMVTGESPNAVKRGVFARQSVESDCTMRGSCQSSLQPKDVSYLPWGGTGLFSLGIIDSKFSENDREARLAVLAATTGQGFGFGIDKNTALLVSATSDKTEFEVIGEQGVQIFDMWQSKYHHQIKDNGTLQTQVTGLSHYITNGDKAVFNEPAASLQIYFSDDKKLLDEAMNFKENEQGVWRNHVRVNCGEKTAIQWRADKVTYQLEQTPESAFATDANKQYCAYKNLSFSISN